VNIKQAVISLLGDIMAASDSTKKALHNYFEKQARKVSRPKKRNFKPEKQVELECVQWMTAQGWDIGIYEAKAVYNPHAGRYLRGVMKAGTVDCQGVMPDGTFVAVEFKAPGRLKTFNSARNDRQRIYLINKINHNAFGAVVDSAKLLAEIYESWAKEEDPYRKWLLMDFLP
jgi:hypothetical protein